MTQTSTGCLILACGNTLRSDDGAGPWLASWAEEQFQDDPHIRVIARQQWTPDLAEEISRSEAVLFIDCSLEHAAGSVRVVELQPRTSTGGLATHHSDAAELLDLCRDLYRTLPRHALLMTIGAGSIELGEEFSQPVAASLPHARTVLQDIVARF